MPHQSQHRILISTQALLETSCFKFAQKWFPEVLEEKGWDCAEAAELPGWLALLAKYRVQAPPTDTEDVKDPFAKSQYTLLHQIRHVAVHMQLRQISQIAEMLFTAHALADALDDVTSAGKIEGMLMAVQDFLKVYETKCSDIQGQLDD